MQSSRQISQMGCLPWQDSWPSWRALQRRSCQSIDFISVLDAWRQPVFQLPRQPTSSMGRDCDADMVTISSTNTRVSHLALKYRNSTRFDANDFGRHDGESQSIVLN